MQKRVSELTTLLLEKFPVEFLFLCESQEGVTDHGKRFSLCSELLPPELLAGILSRAAIFIGGDSGARHLTGMVGTRMITFDIFRDELCGPFVPPHRVCRIPTGVKNQSEPEPFNFDPVRVAEEAAKILDNRR